MNRLQWIDWVRYGVTEYLFPPGWYNNEEVPKNFVADNSASKVLAMARYVVFRLLWPNLSSVPLRSLRGPERQGRDIAPHWSTERVFVNSCSVLVSSTHHRALSIKLVIEMHVYLHRVETKITHHPLRLLLKF